MRATMTWHQRMIWSEGMFLEPQHFQQHDRFIEHLVRSHARATEAWSWGWVAVSLDEVALGLGKIGAGVGVRRAARRHRVLLSRRRARAAAARHPRRRARRTGAARAAAARARRERSSIRWRRDGPADGLRYRAADTTVVDITTSTDRVAEMRVGAPNLRLMLARDATDAYATIGVARVVERRADNRVLLDTALHPADAPRARRTRVCSATRRKSRACCISVPTGSPRASRKPGRGGVAEIADFLLLQTVNRFEPLFAHLLQVPLLHPERLYQTTLALAGDLATFDERRRVLAYPPYRHDDLATFFRAADARPAAAARRRCSSRTRSRSNCRAASPACASAIIADLELLRSASFVLAVERADAGRGAARALPDAGQDRPAERIRDLVNLRCRASACARCRSRRGRFRSTRASTTSSSIAAASCGRSSSSPAAWRCTSPASFPALELEFWAIRLADH